MSEARKTERGQEGKREKEEGKNKKRERKIKRGQLERKSCRTMTECGPKKTPLEQLLMDASILEKTFLCCCLFFMLGFSGMPMPAGFKDIDLTFEKRSRPDDLNLLI